jgi:hypothetical protein
MDGQCPGLICTVDSARRPSTPNAIARCFRAFERFDRPRQGAHAVLSVKRQLLLWLVGCLSTPHTTTSQAPMEVMVPEARRMSFYHLINDLFRALQERGYVKLEAEVADELWPQTAAA